MKKAWIENNGIRDIAPGANPFSFYHPDIAQRYDTEVPDEAENGDTFAAGVLTKRPIPEPPEPQEPAPVVPPSVSAIEFKMLFTSAERIAAKASVDPIIVDLWELLNDPRTTTVNLALKSTQDALDYMTYLGLIAPGRKAEILLGQVT